MRKPMIAGNWKLHKTIAEAKQLSKSLVESLADVEGIDIVIAPVYTALSAVAETISGSPVKLAAQNCYPQETGAFTGEVSPLLLQDAGCEYVILGHSERRQLLDESDSFINQKLVKALEAGLKPILCIGETLQERGARVTVLPLYRRRCPEHPPEQLRALQDDGPPDAIIALSGETLNNLIALGENSVHNLYNALLVVPAARVAKQARDAGFRRVLVPDGLDAPALIASIEQWPATQAPETQSKDARD